MIRILDACCGSRMFWFDKSNPDVVYGDKRNEGRVKCSDTRFINLSPDVQFDFCQMPFKDNSFQMVVFDPPHLLRAGPKSWMAKKYGKLSKDWEIDIKNGFSECFRVLKEGGTLIFKWNETHVPISSILKLTDQWPLFGHRTGKQAKTHWISFIK